MAPVVTINSPTSLTVTWTKPVRANGVLEYYIIRLNQEQIEIRDVSLLNVTVNTLLPYTNYSVSLTVCSGKTYIQITKSNNSKWTLFLLSLLLKLKETTVSYFCKPFFIWDNFIWQILVILVIKVIK